MYILKHRHGSKEYSLVRNHHVLPKLARLFLTNYGIKSPRSQTHSTLQHNRFTLSSIVYSDGTVNIASTILFFSSAARDEVHVQRMAPSYLHPPFFFSLCYQIKLFLPLFPQHPYFFLVLSSLPSKLGLRRRCSASRLLLWLRRRR
jgi:hypothetical protein